MDAEALEQVLACLKTTSDLKLCPNRVWSVAGINLPKLLPRFNSGHRESYSDQGRQDDPNGSEQDNHKTCAYDFCEFSVRNFTSVQQRHECGGSDCMRVPGRFPRGPLDDAARSRQSTVWALKGDKLLESHRPYMAISHVWSDGTGVGAWKDGQVNECLYSFFRDIAEQFECEGIWWDTLCIPSEKTARAVAIGKIQENYLDARITLVHDCFLRNWEWDPETACFGLLMSPWFSRGWTALELASSRKVKVIFKGPHGRSVIKDLDEEILAKCGSETPSNPREEATRIIQLVRRPPFETQKHDRRGALNNLLTVMSPRHTSWPKDMAVISALLLGTSPLEGQQDTYRSILRKCGWIFPGHLFHHSATMSQGFNWCPTSLFNLPIQASSPPLFSLLEIVSADGDIRGTWRLRRVETSLAENLLWEHGKPSVTQLNVLSAFASPSSCRLLAERGLGAVERAILVKTSDRQASKCEAHRYEYVGAVRFRRELPSDGWSDVEATICGSLHGSAGGRTHGPGDPEPQSQPQEETSAALTDAMWRGQHESAGVIMDSAVADTEPNPRARSLLHLAAERGDEAMVLLLEKRTSATDLELYQNMQCEKGRTPLHLAAWSGNARVVQRLLHLGSDAGAVDKARNLPLHIASRMGFEAVVNLLLEADRSHINATARNGLTPVHYAAMNGHHGVLSLLVDEGAELGLTDSFGMAPIHYAASSGNASTIWLLMKHHADVNLASKIGWTPLHLAAMNGDHEVVKILLHHGADAAATDKYGWKPETFARIKGHEAVFPLLRQHTDDDPAEAEGIAQLPGRLHLLAIDDPRRLPRSLTTIDPSVFLSPRLKGGSWESLLPWAAKQGLIDGVRWLLDLGANVEVEDVNEDRRTALSLAAEHGHDVTVEILLCMKADVYAVDGSGWTPLVWAAKGLQSSMIELLQRHDVDINMQGRSGHTALSMATKRGDEAAVRQLIACGADVNARDWGRPGMEHVGKTPLERAIRGKNPAILKLLVDSGATFTTGNTLHETILCAVCHENEAAVELFLDLRTKFEPGSGDSFPKLHLRTLYLAARTGNVPIVEMLLNWRARRIQNGTMVRRPVDEHVALYSGIYYGNMDLVRALIAKGTKLNPSGASEHDPSPLGLACWHTQTAMIKLLRDHGARIDHNLPNDRKAMQEMASTGKDARDLVRQLRDEGIARSWTSSLLGSSEPDLLPDMSRYLGRHYFMLHPASRRAKRPVTDALSDYDSSGEF